MKHATANAAELRKVLGMIGTKIARKGDVVAWYRTDYGLAVKVRAPGGADIIAGEPRTIDAIEAGLSPSKWSRAQQTDALLDAKAEPVHAYQAAEADDGTGTPAPRQEPLPVVAQLGLAAGGLLESLAWCVKATATDEARPVMQAVHVQMVGGAARLVAADNYRLHIAGGDPRQKAEHSAGLPRKLAQYLAARGESVLLDYHAMQDGRPHGATLRSLGLIVRIPDAPSFPPFESIIPKQEEATAKASIGVSSAVAATKEAAKEATLAEALEGGRVSSTTILTLAAGARGVLVASSKQEPRRVDSTHGTGGEAAAVNADYLREALEGMRETASLYLAGEQRPLVLQDYDRTAIVMPIRSKEESMNERMQKLRDLVGQEDGAAKLRALVCGKCGEPVEKMAAPLPGEPDQARGVCSTHGEGVAVPVHRDAVAATA
jgi:hypothetical protein